MRVVTFVSVKGSPGVTTLACLVAATWPDHRRVAVVEADPFGGDLAARFRLSTALGWSSYLTASRRSEVQIPLSPHLQALPGGLDVLVRPDGRREVSAHAVDSLLRSSGSPEHVPRDLVVDGGRLPVDGGWAGTREVNGGDDTETGPWLDRSDLVVVVTRRDPPSILKVRERAPGLAERCGDRVRLVVVGPGPHDSAAIENFTGLSVLSEVPSDSVAAHVAAGEAGSARQLSRSLLVASARRLALTVARDGDVEGDAPGVGEQEGTVDRTGKGEDDSRADERDQRHPSGMGRTAERRSARRLTHFFRRGGRRRGISGLAGDVAPSLRSASTLESAWDPAESRTLAPVPAEAAANGPRREEMQ
jgi:hypothetical protein